MKKCLQFFDDEKLIEAVKSRPLMYDVDDPQHNSRQMLFKSWREVAQEVGEEVNTVKERWVSMRDYYRKKIRELEKIKSGQLDKKFKKWSLFDKLDFLRPFLRRIEIDTTSTLEPENSVVEDGRNYSDVDSEEEGVHLGPCIRLVKSENTDEEEDDNQSDDSYRKEIVQALELDSGHSSLDIQKRKKSGKRQNHNINEIKVRRRPAYLEVDDIESTQATKSKKQRLEWTHPTASFDFNRDKHISATARGLPAETNANHQFFASLIPMIETLDSLTAMEFRHEVHGLLLNYLKNDRELKKTDTANNINDTQINNGVSAPEVTKDDIQNSNHNVENGAS